jgi:hypothetical protein
MANTSESTEKIPKSSSRLSDSHGIPAATDKVASPPQVTDKDTEETTIEHDNAETDQYITGFALKAVVAGLTMAVFLLMLDSTILVTVSQPCMPVSLSSTQKYQGHSEDHEQVQLTEGHWLVWQRISARNVSLSTSAKAYLHHADQSQISCAVQLPFGKIYQFYSSKVYILCPVYKRLLIICF